VAPAVLIAGKDLRRRIRDRSAILTAVILPFGLAWIFSLTLAGVGGGGFEAAYAVADADRGELSRSFTQTLRELDFVTLTEAADAAEADRLADDGEVDAAFVFPDGFTAQVQAGGGGTLEVIASPESSVGALVAESIASSFVARLDAVGVSIATVQTGGGGPEEVAARAEATPASAVVRDVATEDRVFTPTTFFAIGMAVFFLFFAVEFGVRGLLEEREEGTLARLLVAPLRPSAVLAGKALASLAVGLVSTSLLVIASSWLLDASWGDPIGVALLVLAGVSTAVAVTALVSTFGSSSAQAGSYAAVVAVVGGLLGGTFFPISQAPGALAAVRFLAPQGWLMDGFQALAGGGGVAEVLPALTGTVVIGSACGAAAWVRASRLVAR
jgi:ABC-2 type transport system permease protein